MNPYIEFAQWTFTTWKGWYASHGTKILGALSTAFSSVVAYLALISSSPDFDLLVTPKQFAVLALINAALGGAMFKRGFTNSKPSGA
jgi:uncharacterized YccA/Bax inhibitor family protein